MIKSLTSKLLIVVVLIFIALSSFWFFKTSIVKKQILSSIEKSEGVIAASSVSVSGFPINQIVTIENIKINPDSDLIKGKTAEKIPSIKINIKKLQAKATIFSGEFSLLNLGEISIVDSLEQTTNVQFNQNPQLKFSLSGGKINKLSYRDNGMKIIDASKNKLYEDDSFVFDIENQIKDEKQHIKIKANLAGININKLEKISAIKNLPDAVKPAQETINQNSISKDGSDVVALNANEPSNKSSEIVKSNYNMDVEFIVEAKSITTIPPAQENQPPVVASAENLPTFSVIINKIEISNSSYKITANGELSAPKSNLLNSSYNISLKIDKIDNLINDVLGFLGMPKIEKQIPVVKEIKDQEQNLASAEKLDITSTSKTDLENNNSLLTSNKAENEEITIDKEKSSVNLFITNIKKLASQNPASSEELSVFDFRKEVGKDIFINEASYLEIMDKLLSTPQQELKKEDSMPQSQSNSPITEEKLTTPANPTKGETESNLQTK